MIEVGLNYTDRDEHAFFSANERRHVNNILRLAEKHPNEVTIILRPEDNGGHVLAWIPKRWVKISPPRNIDLTDEQRAELSARARANFGKNDEDEEIYAEDD
ncbi:MAG: hypothetical protein WC374_05955 [Phycisphaerae bacterium]|jgi:hypothetical protein